MSCIIGHYVVDAVFLSIPLIRSENTYFLALGIAVIAFTALPGVFGAVGAARGSEAQPPA